MMRFQREAEVLASLNHPNIAHIYGVEERALAMELVEGESPKGPMPFEDAMEDCVADRRALTYAHEKGIVHRDLTPANIKVTPDGVVKLLDFGLAKAISGTPDSTSVDPENSPTLTMGATVAGVILGPSACMSPEQARGKSVDRRADIWAFGVVLYELLTGKQLFRGEDLTDTLENVVKTQPDLSEAPDEARVLEACLEKDPKKRLQAIGDVRYLIGAGASAPAPQSATTGWMLTAAALAIVAGVALWAPRRAAVPAEQPLVRFDVELGPDVSLAPNTGALNTVVLSTDGTRFAWDGANQPQLLNSEERTGIWLRTASAWLW